MEHSICIPTACNGSHLKKFLLDSILPSSQHSVSHFLFIEKILGRMSSPHCLQFLSSFFFLNPLPLGLEPITPPKTSMLLNPILKSCSPLLTCSIYSTDLVEYSLLLELPSFTRTSLSPSSPAMLVVPSQCLLLFDHILESSVAPSLDVFSSPCMSTLGISPGLKVLIHTKKQMAPQDISQAGSTPLNSIDLVHSTPAHHLLHAL